MKSTGNLLYIKYLSLFENTSKALITSTNRDNDTGNVIWRKMAYQFARSLSNKIKINSQTIFDAINNERELFIAAAKLTFYSILALKNNDQWIDESGPIAFSLLLASEGVTGQIYEKLEQNHLLCESFDSLMKEINQDITVRLDILRKKYTEENKLKEFTVDMQSVANQASDLFDRLFFTPEHFDKTELQHHLSELVALNTPYLIRAICEKVPSPIDLTPLVLKAMRKLSFETLNVLIELGADINKEILLYSDVDMNLRFSGPLLLYPFLPLMLGGQVQLGIFGQCCSPLFRPDHPKLINMMSYLIEHGATPNQKITLEQISVRNNDKDRDSDQKELDMWQKNHATFKQIAHDLISDEEIKPLTPDFINFLTKISHWTPATKTQNHIPTQEEITSYVKFVTNQFTELTETDWYKAWSAKQNENVELRENNNRFKM
ncbi:MAG: hypothetical protein H0W64_10005 [Gammaproteobacteria bacterium]|nr:hypothetical protein [Gammaproteobacteria bacterium]